MRRILHLSDLHFGRVNTDLEAPLLAQIAALTPDLVVISGDLTQRARPDQFRAARAFMDRIDAPHLTVPGNHDTPLYNLAQRFFRPFSRYKRFISNDLEPMFTDPELTVLGVNTVNPFAWQRGKLSSKHLAGISARLGEDKGRIRIIALHHPPEQEPDTAKRLMKGAREALVELSNCGADLVLSGHLHQGAAAPFRAAPDLLFVQAGTGLSTRLRGQQQNTFNQIDIENDTLKIVMWAAQSNGFVAEQTTRWRREDGNWRKGDTASDHAPSP
jgi:3',5'-cyclic AMP phosphodiesterase CpdA